MKRFLICSLALFIMLSAVPAVSFAQDTRIINEEAEQYEIYTDHAPKYNATVYEIAEQRILAAFENCDDTVDLSDLNIPKSEFSKFYFGVRENNPQYFYIEGRINYSISGRNDNIIEAYPAYSATGSELDEMREKFDKAVNEALAQVKEGMSDLEKALVLHDYLDNTAEYDVSVYDKPETTSPYSYTAYGVLVNKIGVCQSYSFAYKLLLDLKCNVPVKYMSSESMNHIWTQVQINGKYYNVDVTWDDPTDDRLGRVDHNYFLKSDSEFEGHSGYDTSLNPCTDTTFDNNAVWEDVSSKMCYLDGDFYYISPEKKIVKYNFTTKKLTTVKDVTDTWKVLDNPPYYYLGTYSSMSLVNGVLYYNMTDKICSCNPDGSNYKEILTVNTASKYIFGSAYRNGGLYYTYKSKPDSPEDIRLAILIEEEQPEEPIITPDFDLYASAIMLPTAMSEDAVYTASATVRNLGSEAVPEGALVSFYVDGTLISTERVNKTIESGRGVTVSSSASPKAVFGSHTVKIIIEHEKYTDEADKSNNIRKTRFVID